MVKLFYFTYVFFTPTTPLTYTIYNKEVLRHLRGSWIEAQTKNVHNYIAMVFFCKYGQFETNRGIFITILRQESLFHHFENISSWVLAFSAKFMEFQKFKVPFSKTKKYKNLCLIVTALRKLIGYLII
jgi:hypothetical protein